MRIRIPPAVLDDLRAHAASAAPEEACGALVGRFLARDTTAPAEGVGVVGRFLAHDTTSSAEGVGVVGRVTAHDTTASAEGVGVVGRFTGARDRDVVRAVSMRNSHREPRTAFLLDPIDVLAVQARADADGLDIVGFYHSHPEGPAGPSATDVAQATWAGASYLVLWLRPTPGYGSWRWDEAGARFVAEEVVLG